MATILYFFLHRQRTLHPYDRAYIPLCVLMWGTWLIIAAVNVACLGIFIRRCERSADYWLEDVSYCYAFGKFSVGRLLGLGKAFVAWSTLAGSLLFVSFLAVPLAQG